MSLTRLAAAFALLALVWLPAAAMAGDTSVLNGTVTYRERMALPPGARIEVELVDVSRADAPARIVAATTVTPQTQVPVAYSLAYEPAGIVAGHSYAVQARILLDDRLLFTTAERHAVLGDEPDRTDIVVRRVPGPGSPAGNWLLEDIRGGGVIDRLQTVLEIAGDGRVSGTGGCNRMGGSATIEGDRIAFGRLVATQMACVPAAMNQEQKFFAALGQARGWRIDEARDKLELIDEAGDVILVLARQ